MVDLDDLDGLPVHPSFNASMPQGSLDVYNWGKRWNMQKLDGGILDGILKVGLVFSIGFLSGTRLRSQRVGSQLIFVRSIRGGN